MIHVDEARLVWYPLETHPENVRLVWDYPRPSPRKKEKETVSPKLSVIYFSLVTLDT